MKKALSHLWAVAWNIILAMLLYSCCRLVFFLVNRPLLEGADLLGIMRHGLLFDFSALMYGNALYIILMLIPFAFRKRKWYRTFTKGLFVLVNFFLYAIDMADSVYFAYTLRRTTCTVFREFAGDSNVPGIILHETLTHWYLLLAGLAMLVILIKCYRQPAEDETGPYGFGEFLLHLVTFVAAPVMIVFGMRGSFDFQMRPISLSDANLYIEKPVEAGLVLNTAFSLIRTADSKPFNVPEWFPSEEALEAEFTPVHPAPSAQGIKGKNVVVLVLESFSASYSAYLTGLQGEEHTGYMPFLDSLMKESLIFRHSIANGRTSIESLPSVMCGIPSFIEPFTLTPYAQNDVSGLAAELRSKGYHTAFYHGAKRESMAIAGFAHASGFEREYSREDFGDDTYYDGTWGIWDGPFLDYFEKGISGMQEPFLASVFTLTSHNPFVIPADAPFPEGTIPIHKCIRYTDSCLKRFFDAASGEPWFRNTLFVITGDHTNASDLKEYNTAAGVFTIPIVFYTPDGSLRGLREGIAQQADIKPTVLSYLGYDEPYFSFGCDLLTTADEDTYAVNYHAGIYQFFRAGWLLQFDGEKPVALYRFADDRLLEKNLLDEELAVASAMEQRLKAIIQQYITRMTENRVSDGR